MQLRLKRRRATPIGDGDWGCNTLQIRQTRRVACDGSAMRGSEAPAIFYRDVAISLPRLKRGCCARPTYFAFALSVSGARDSLKLQRRIAADCTGGNPDDKSDVQVLISAGSLPPLAASFVMICLCNQTFVVAESLVSPV